MPPAFSASSPPVTRPAASVGAVGDDLSGPDLRGFSSGSGWIDGLLGGGHAPGLVYALRTAVGGGRTTVGSMIAAGGAGRLGRPDRRDGGTRRVVVLVNFGEPAIWTRFRSFGAGIDRGRLYSRIPGGARPPASFGRDPGKAEGGWSARAGLLPDEAQSLDVFDDEVGESLVVLDLVVATGHGASVESIAARVAESCRVDGLECVLIVIDSLELAVLREFGDHVEDSKGEIRRYPDRCRRLLAAPFHCPVWLLGELPGEPVGWPEVQARREGLPSGFEMSLDACIDLHGGPGAIAVARTSWSRDPDLIGRSCRLRLEGALGRFVRVEDAPGLPEGGGSCFDAGAAAG